MRGFVKIPRCVCGRVWCDSINRDRWTICRSESIKRNVMSNERGLCPVNGEYAWWVDKDGARVCPEGHEKHFFSFINCYNAIRHFREVLCRRFKTKARYSVVRMPLSSDNVSMECPFVFDHHLFGNRCEHCTVGARAEVV